MSERVSTSRLLNSACSGLMYSGVPITTPWAGCRGVHQGRGLPLRVEARHDAPGVHPRLDELQRDLAPYRLRLLGRPDGSHAPFADLFQQLVTAGDDHAWLLARSPFGVRLAAEVLRGRAVEEAVGLIVGLQQGLDALAEGGIPGASLLQVS